MWKNPYWIVEATSKINNRPLVYFADTLEEALLAKKEKEGEFIVRISLALGMQQFIYNETEKRLVSHGKFSVTWEMARSPLYFNDVNDAMEAYKTLRGVKKEGIEIQYIKAEQRHIGVDNFKEDINYFMEHPTDFVQRVMGLAPTERKDPAAGRPDRDSIISQEEITNLTILLNTENDIDKLLKQI